MLFAALGGLGLTSCGKKEEAPAEGGNGEVALTSTEEVPPPPPPKASPADRAAALGFAKYLPADTQGFLGIYDGAGLVNELRESKLGKFVEQIAASEGMDLNDINEEPQAAMVLSLLKEELFVAVGNGTDKQTSNLLQVQQSNSFHQMKILVQLAAAATKGEDFDDDDLAIGALTAMFNDPKGVMAVLDSAKMPPLMIGFKVSDEEARTGLSQMVAGGLGEFVAMAGPDGEDVAEALEVPAGEVSLTGVRLIGAKVVAKLEEEGAKEEISEVLEPATVDRLFQGLAKKNLVVASGVIDQYLVFFVGSDAADLKLAEAPEKSLVSSGELSFVDGFLGKKLIAVSTLSKPLLDSLGRGEAGLGNLAAGIKAGLSETEAFGDTRDLEVLLDLIGKQEKALVDSFQYVPAGLVAYRDKGYKFEAFGGSNRPDLDLASEHKFGALADWDGALLYAAAIGDDDYTEKSLEYLDTVGETFYLAAKKISKLDMDDGDFEEFQQGFGMFDEMFREDVLRLWKALRGDLSAGLGGETAVVIDLKGSLPTVPGLAPVLIEEAKAPRLGVVAPIGDRERLGESWKNINGSLESILKTVSEMSGNNIPMQKPMSSEKDDLTSWFFATIPFQTDDFVFSISLDKENFYATTSKTFTKELADKVSGAGGGQKGAHLRLDFVQLRVYLEETLALVDKNADAVFGGNDGAAAEFRQNLPQIRAVLDAFSELKDLQAHTRQEGGRVRSSLHLNLE